MRYSLQKKYSTKPERIVYEILKELHTPFKHRWLIGGKEIDFIVGKYAIEIDGHEQISEKNKHIFDSGFIPIHLSNNDIITNKVNIKNLIKNLWQEY